MDTLYISVGSHTHCTNAGTYNLHGVTRPVQDSSVYCMNRHTAIFYLRRALLCCHFSFLDEAE